MVLDPVEPVIVPVEPVEVALVLAGPGLVLELAPVAPLAPLVLVLAGPGANGSYINDGFLCRGL